MSCLVSDSGTVSRRSACASLAGGWRAGIVGALFGFRDWEGKSVVGTVVCLDLGGGGFIGESVVGFINYPASISSVMETATALLPWYLAK